MTLTVQVFRCSEEEAEWLRNDAVEFLIESGAIDGAEYTVTELT